MKYDLEKFRISIQPSINERNNMTRKISFGVLDHLDPDVAAMVMAKYSRDLGFIEDRIPDSKESADKHRSALRQYYLNYGHGSIGNCMSTSCFTENVSMLAAEAIVNNQLYKGQWSSSRYLDFATQPMVDTGSIQISEWQEKFRVFYLKAIPLTQAMLKEQFPFKANEGHYHHKEDSEVQLKRKYTIWENTIKARAFDICRGLLPAGITTKGCTFGEASTFNQHFGQLLHHPLAEVRDIAKEVLTQFEAKYPDAANSVEKLTERYKYMADNRDYFYHNGVSSNKLCDDSKLFFETSNYLAKPREKFEEMPKFINDLTRFTYTDTIDYGSYRDLHRHRRGTITMPVLTISNGFHDYYINSLPEVLKPELMSLLNDYASWYNQSTLSDVDKQYSTPMGYCVKFSYTCDMNQLLYINELRSSKTVHQTLRKVCHNWSQYFSNFYPEIQLHVDFDEDNFSLKRGMQTHIKE